MGQYDVIAYGPSGRLDAGDVITGAANVAAVYVQNGIARYYPASDDGVEGWLYRWDGDSYVECLDASQGDGAFFVTRNSNAPDRITVVKCTTDEVELSAEWDAWDFNNGYLSTPGVGYRDFNNPGPALNWAEGATGTNNNKFITEARVTKVAIMRRGTEGVFLGWHSDPRVGPLDCQIPEYNNSTDWGEREFHLGYNSRVTFSSAGVECLHPDFGADSIWGSSAGGANYATARHCWLGIDDPNYPPYDQAAYISHQPSGYPAEQTTGPWWVATLHYQNATTYPFCAYFVLRERMEIGSFQFQPGDYGQVTLHFTVESHDASNIPHRTQCFLGAFPYVSTSLADEPTASLRAMVANRANEDFELSGQAVLEPETTTVAEVRDTMIDAVTAASPVVLTNRRYVAHREEVDLRTFCENAPASALRRFSIRDTFDHEGPFASSPDYREMRTTIVCEVAYPKQSGYRDDASVGRPLLDMHDVIRSDLHVIRTTIGVRGYAALERDGINAAVTGEDWTVDEGDACVYSVLRLRTMYREDPL